ncbi:MAG: FAD-linked oxidase C-terminal domain-containing protein [Promethearchaeota archaeon]
MDDAFREKVERAVGKANVRWSLEGRYPYGFDGAPPERDAIPDGVAFVRSTEQVQGVAMACHEHRVPLTARGGGSSLSGGPVAPAGGLVVDFNRMDAVLSVDPGDAVVCCQPGVNCDDLNATLASHGLFFPPDPGSSSVATVGGMVANDSGGVQALKYGVTRHYVLWLEVVLADGERVRFGSRVLKSASGLNLAGLFVGSEGQLGLVTEVGLRVVPLPEARRTGTYVFEDIVDACEAAVAVRVSGVLPNVLELMDAATTAAALDHLGVLEDEVPRGNLLLVECDGSQAAVAADFERVDRLVTSRGPIHRDVAEDPTSRERVMSARKAALPALSRSSPTTAIEDFTVRVTDVPAAVAGVQRLDERLSRAGVRVAVFGHVGDGNLHPTFTFDERDPAQAAAFREGLDALYREVVVPLGGSVTGEHGIGLVKSPYLELEHGTAAVAWFHRVKELFDPLGILNPGKGKAAATTKFVRGPVFPESKPYRGPHTKALSCMRCGFCVRSCPSWQEFRDEARSPRGRLAFVRGLLDHELRPTRELQDVFMSCSLCGACAVKCPAGVEVNDVVEKLRRYLHGQAEEEKEGGGR